MEESDLPLNYDKLVELDVRAVLHEIGVRATKTGVNAMKEFALQESKTGPMANILDAMMRLIESGKAAPADFGDDKKKKALAKTVRKMIY